MFVENGYDRVTMDQVAAVAHIGKQTLYQLFPGKERLFEAVVNSRIASFNVASFSEEGDVEATLLRYVSRVYPHFISQPRFELHRLILLMRRDLPDVAARLQLLQRKSAGSLQAYLEEMMAAGELSPHPWSLFDLSTRLGAIVTEGTRYYLGHQPLTGVALAEHARSSVKLFLNGCSALDSAAFAFDPPLKENGLTRHRPLTQVRMDRSRLEGVADEALNVFCAHGFDRAGLSEVVARSGVGKAAIYRHFGDKEGLYRSVVGDAILDIADDRIEAPAGPNLETRLASLARLALDRHLEERCIAMHHLHIRQAHMHGDLSRAFYDAQISRLGEPLTSILLDEGLPAPPAGLVRMFHTLATFGTRFLTTLVTIDDDAREAVSRQAARIMARGIA